MDGTGWDGTHCFAQWNETDFVERLVVQNGPESEPESVLFQSIPFQGEIHSILKNTLRDNIIYEMGFHSWADLGLTLGRLLSDLGPTLAQLCAGFELTLGRL